MLCSWGQWVTYGTLPEYPCPPAVSRRRAAHLCFGLGPFRSKSDATEHEKADDGVEELHIGRLW